MLSPLTISRSRYIKDTKLYIPPLLCSYTLGVKNKGVNFTSGLDVIRVSPDFGTAYDIIGKNIATTESLINCIKFLNFHLKFYFLYNYT